jgi:hypothetical protein
LGISDIPWAITRGFCLHFLVESRMCPL